MDMDMDMAGTRTGTRTRTRTGTGTAAAVCEEQCDAPLARVTPNDLGKEGGGAIQQQVKGEGEPGRNKDPVRV